MLSYEGGLSERCFHNRTVPSLDADSTAFEDGNATARTYFEASCQYSGIISSSSTYIVFMTRERRR